MIPTRSRISLLAAFLIALSPIGVSAEMVLISEIMYHPPAGKPEYVELANNTATPLDIANWRLTGGISFEFPDFATASAAATFLKPFERIVVTSADPADARAAYAIPAAIRVFGPWSRNLDDNGDRVTIEDKNGTTVASVSYNDRGKWPVSADGAGHSLVLKNPDATVGDWRNWAPSAAPGGTPGTVEALPASSQGIRLNEILFKGLNTVSAVEIANTSAKAVTLDGMFVASDRTLTNFVRLAGIVAAGGLRLLETAFVFEGNEVTLFVADASNVVSDAQTFTRPIGRDSIQAFPDGSREWYSSEIATIGRPNDPGRSSDVVINEIMFAPPSGEITGEFIELFNRSDAAVDVSGWRFTDGVDFRFPAGTTIKPGGFLVVAANAEWMRRVYVDIPVVGDFADRLSNEGELVRLADQWGNLVDEVDYNVEGDWPDLTSGGGSSMELVHPAMDNDLASAWRDSDELQKSPVRHYSFRGTFQQLRTMNAVTDYKEMHLMLVRDGHVILENISLLRNGGGTNLLVNVTKQSTNNASASGWLVQGNHWKSHVNPEGQLHIISTGRGDNRPNHVELDATALAVGQTYEFHFDGRWVSGSPRLVAQSWDHSFSQSFRLEIPENLGTPGATNSRHSAEALPQLHSIRHSPAVPTPTQNVKVTVHVANADSVTSVQLHHRADSLLGNAPWLTKPMHDDGVTGGDLVAGDGVFTAELTEYKVLSRIVQFYASAQSQSGQQTTLPKRAVNAPAMYVVDGKTVAKDLRSGRFIMSAYHRDALRNGGTAKFNYRFPRLSNQYFNMTYISNERDIYYGAEMRESGSPFWRDGSLKRAKWKLPADRAFRGQTRLYYDDEQSPERRHYNRIARYMLYLLGSPANNNEFIRVILNAEAIAIREDTEPVGNSFLDRNFENGSSGNVYDIDLEWWLSDSGGQESMNASFGYKNTDNPNRYRTEWLKKSNEDDDDFYDLTTFFKTFGGTYTQSEIERLMNQRSFLKMQAVRGYCGDWDTITMDAGRNGYLFRPAGDTRFQMLHWDGDWAFTQSAGSQPFWGQSEPRFKAWIEKPYNKRVFFAYLVELLENYTRNSARMDAWLKAEEDATTAFTVTTSFFRTWFSSRETFAKTTMAANYTRPLAITSPNPLTVATETATITGSAPYGVFDIEIESHPGAVIAWTSDILWTASGIRLRTGDNQLVVNGLDTRGQIRRTASILVRKTGNAAPIVKLDSDPGSLHVSVTEPLQLNAGQSFDPDGDSLTFEWTISPSEAVSLETNEFGQALVFFDRPGAYRVGVTVRDPQDGASTVARDVAVFGPEGFSTFGTTRLEEHWQIENVALRTTYSPDVWVSLNELPGRLVMQNLNTTIRPLASSQPAYPSLWRDVPSAADWTFETRLELITRVFGNYHAGALVEVRSGDTTRRIAFAIENGKAIVARTVSADGSSTELKRQTWLTAELPLRIRRAGATLVFELKTDDLWEPWHTEPLGEGATTERVGLFLANTLAESVRVAFDFALLADPGNGSSLLNNLRLTELMYNPIGGDDFEFVELYNAGSLPLDLTGLRFVTGITYAFAPTSLAAGQHIVIARNRNAFASRYGTRGILAATVFTGRLDNGGETLTLVDAAGNVILSFQYGDAGDWPGRADGFGSSLELARRGEPGDPDNWRSSSEFGGSPGRTGAGPLRTIVINEVLTHTDAPLEDAIELHNLTEAAIDIGGWYLSDSRSVPRKFRVPDGTSIGALGYAVFYEYQFNTNNTLVPFSLSSADGDDVILTSADAAGNLTFFVDTVEFDSSENGVSLGRYPNGVGPIVAMSDLSLGTDVRAGESPERNAVFKTGRGAPNAYPKVGPIVFREIMYNPVLADDEFIELQNITGQAIPLFDPVNPENRWMIAGAIEFAFPAGTVLPGFGRIIVTQSSPAAFKLRHSVPADVQVVGPYVGSLDNGGETLELYKPDPPQIATGFVPFILVEKVRYDNRLPWPSYADGLGASLKRISLFAYANTPANWSTAETDYDGDSDGMDDLWELSQGFDREDSADGAQDADSDGLSNREEYVSGTDPRSASSTLHIETATFEAGAMTVQFQAIAGRYYSLEYREDGAVGDWIALAGSTATASGRFQLVDSASAGYAQRFYRVVVRK